MTSYRIINALFRVLSHLYEVWTWYRFLRANFSILVIGAFIALSIYLIRLDNIIRENLKDNAGTFRQGVCSTFEIYNNAPITQANFTQELKLLGYKTSSNYDKSGTYVAQGSNMYVHTRGFDYGDSVESEQVLELSFANDQVVEVRSTKPSSTELPV